MKKLNSIVDKIEKKLDQKEKLREIVLKNGRNVIQSCRKTIYNIHNNSISNAEKNMKKATNELKELLKRITGQENMDLFYSGFMENLFQEIVEANCLISIMKDEHLPDPDDLNVTYSSYLLGLSDVVGELRRLALNEMINENTDKANNYLNQMEEIYNLLIKFDYPSGFIPLKKKQDMVRGLIEKTRGEITVAICERRISDKIDEFRSLSEKPTKTGSANNKRREGLELNIDKVW